MPRKPNPHEAAARWSWGHGQSPGSCLGLRRWSNGGGVVFHGVRPRRALPYLPSGCGGRRSRLRACGSRRNTRSRGSTGKTQGPLMPFDGTVAPQKSTSGHHLSHHFRPVSSNCFHACKALSKSGVPTTPCAGVHPTQNNTRCGLPISWKASFESCSEVTPFPWPLFSGVAAASHPLSDAGLLLAIRGFVPRDDMTPQKRPRFGTLAPWTLYRQRRRRD